MRERYFRMYEAIKYKEQFYEAHAIRANRRYEIFSAIVLLISIGSALIWSISKTMPALWSVVIAAAQFAQAYSVNLPYAKQISALHYLLPELKILLIGIDRDWLLLDINEYSDQALVDLITKYDTNFAQLENQFVGDIAFPRTKRILKQAEDGTTAYFKARYTYTSEQKEEHTNASKS